MNTDSPTPQDSSVQAQDAVHAEDGTHVDRGPTLAQRMLRALAPVLVTTLTLQPFALYAAPNPSLLAQSPKLLDTSVPANVVFLMDDSLSMDDVRLPVPQGLNPNESAGGQVTVRGQATGYSTSSGAWTVSSALSVERVNEWIFRSAVLNPLYYNPAITYRPWNDNGREGGSGNFQNAGVGSTAQVTDPSTSFRFSLTRQDMRYAGPNYAYGNQNNFGWRNAALGTNPAPVPPYLQSSRPASGGFPGSVDAQNRNQDLFTSPMVQSTGGSPQCTVTPTNPVLTAAATVDRGWTPQPSTTLTPTTRPSDPITTPSRQTQSRGVYDRALYDRQTSAPTTNVAATLQMRTTSALNVVAMGQARASTAPTTDSNRTVVDRTWTAPTADSNRTPVDRSSTALSAPINRTTTNRPLEYRQEQGACGNWGPWTTSQPATAFCSDPNSEGGVRLALVQSRYAACPANSSPNGDPSTATQCISDCPSNTTATATQCVYSCASGTDLINGRCYAACGGATPNYWGGSNNAATSTQCIASCPANTTPSGTQCIGGCTTGTNLIGGRCYAACSGATPNYWGASNNAATSTQCISTCPSGTTTSGTQCLGGGCPSSHPTLISGQCYANCTGTYNVYGTGGISGATQCRMSCSGTVNASDQCETCPTGTTRGNGTFGSNTNLCYSNTCPTGQGTVTGNNYQCQACASGTLVSGQCLTCPSGTNLLTSGTNAGDGLCYGACPTGSPTWSFWNGTGAATSTNSTQCRQSCPTGTGTASTGSNTVRGQCFPACPSNYEALSTNATVCHRTCVNQFGSGFETNPSDNTQCRTVCNAPDLVVGSSCYRSCPSGSPFGTPATQCASSCPSGDLSGNTCYSACPNPTDQLVGRTCYAQCPAAYPTVDPTNVGRCLGTCPSGSLASGTQCQSCPAGNTLLSNGQCCPDAAATIGNCPLNRPPGSSCAAGQWVPDLDRPAPARYFVFSPATPIASPTPSDLVNPANYVRVEINRDRTMSYPKASTRTDCAGSSCTWDEEAQNFANWYTYYRTRLYSAIGVTSASLSGLTADKGLDSLRLGYGSINYFPEGANPYPNINPLLNSRLPTTMTVDGQPSNGALVRGVRPFQQLSSTPPSPGSNDRRQEVFDWLFSLRAVSATPNREALDSVGRYFQRSDNRGPWIRPSTPNETRNWQTNEAATAHISCRRNFTILVTDGEWTRAPYVAGAPQQPLVENTDTPLNALASAGPRLTGLGNRVYQYAPDAEPQWSTNASSAGGTLSDIAFYYWSRDLRPDLPNNVRPVDATDTRQGNPAFWQHLVPYIVGYGISASMDTSSTRQAVIAAARGARTPINWPSVRLEDRATEIGTIVTDRDAAPINCNYDPSTNPSGCGRVNDTLRAALVARGDFLSATDVSGLAAGIASAFTAIGQLTGSSTALTGRSGTLRQGDRLFQATFQTNVWSGRLQSFDAVVYYNALSGSAVDAGVSQRFPAPASRNVLTSTSLQAGGVAFPTGDSDFTNLSAAQRAALGDDSFVPQWMRGDQSRDGAGYRKRAAGEILGDIVNSQPLYSQWTDNGYSAGHAPAAAGSNASTYPQFVRDNKQYRPARVFVGANDGMLHAFDASGTPSSNSNYLTESFAYVPRAVYGALSTLASPNYIHQYLVDGPVVEGDVFINGAWRSVIVGTTGAGPKGLFAIDVTQRTGMTERSVVATDVLWDIAPALDTSTAGIDDVGNIVQPGVIGSGRDGEWYYFVGNGFESSNDKAKLLAIRIRDGAIFPIGTDNAGGSNPSSSSVSNQPNGLGGITPIYDGNRNVVAIYAGDRLGRLWKFDLSSTNRNDWASATGTTPLFTAAAADGTRQAIGAAPRVVPHPLGGRMIVFGTGKVFENNDLMDMTVQAVYGVWEKNVTAPANVAKSALRELTLADITDQVTGKKYRQLQNTTALNWASDLGWFFNLSTGTAYGERVVASPTENFGFVNVTSFEPAANGDPCVGGGRSFFYRLDISGSFTRAPFNTGGLNNLDANIPRNTVVGAELEGPTISGVQTLLRPVDGTTAVSSSLTSTQTSALGGASQSPATNCNTALGGGVGAVGNALTTPTLNCPVAPLRIWRELPRGPR